VTERRWVVVGLEESGEEIERATVLDSRLAEAIEVFKEFSDWIEIVDPAGKEKTRTAWTRGG
jgi:hypothetical protein